MTRYNDERPADRWMRCGHHGCCEAPEDCPALDGKAERIKDERGTTDAVANTIATGFFVAVLALTVLAFAHPHIALIAAGVCVAWLVVGIPVGVAAGRWIGGRR